MELSVIASTDTKNKTITNDVNQQERFGRKPRFMSGKPTILSNAKSDTDITEDLAPKNNKQPAK